SSPRATTATPGGIPTHEPEQRRRRSSRPKGWRAPPPAARAAPPASSRPFPPPYPSPQSPSSVPSLCRSHLHDVFSFHSQVILEWNSRKVHNDPCLITQDHHRPRLRFGISHGVAAS